MELLIAKLFYILVNCYAVISSGKDKKCLDGVCTLISQCPVALANLEKGIFPKICRFENEYSEPTICCHYLKDETSTAEILRIPEQVTEPTDTVVFPEEKPELSIFKIKCKEYALKTCEGRLTVSSIEVENGPKKFPHTALIGYGENLDSVIEWKCSGSLISEFYVLTAARCEYSLYGYAKWVRLGPGTKSFNYTYHEIEQRIIHPDFVHPYLQNDIALFKLKEKIHFDDSVHPICLFEDPEIKPDHLLSVGFGKKNCIDSECGLHTFNELQTEILLETHAELDDIKHCENIFNEWEELHYGVDEKSSICSSLPQPHLEECQGVFGDPLVREIKTGCPSFYELLGVLSAVDHSPNNIGSCYFLNTTMIYIKVSHFLPWIKKIVWNEIR